MHKEKLLKKTFTFVLSPSDFLQQLFISLPSLAVTSVGNCRGEKGAKYVSQFGEQQSD